MFWNPFEKTSKSFLGIDIGTSSIKIVELSRWGKRKKLENYGEMQAEALYEKPFRTFERSTLTVSTSEVVRAIRAILDEAKIKTKKVYFSIPDFSSFFTTFSLPPMTDQELPQAVSYEARQHIPIPLSEVTLDWQKIDGEKILLVAVPNEVIRQYQDIASASQLELVALEAEVFSLCRAAVKEPDKMSVVTLVDMGARSTTISIIENNILKISHSFDMASSDLTDAIAKGLSVDYREAEGLKKKYGFLAGGKNIKELIAPLTDLILNEIQKIFQSFSQTENKETQKVILAGASALIPGIADYFGERLGKPVITADPFSDIYYPPILEETLKTMGPGYTIAVGTALRGVE